MIQLRSSFNTSTSTFLRFGVDEFLWVQSDLLSTPPFTNQRQAKMTPAKKIRSKFFRTPSIFVCIFCCLQSLTILKTRKMCFMLNVCPLSRNCDWELGIDLAGVFWSPTVDGQRKLCLKSHPVSSKSPFFKSTLPKFNIATEKKMVKKNYLPFFGFG